MIEVKFAVKLYHICAGIGRGNTAIFLQFPQMKCGRVLLGKQKMGYSENIPNNPLML